MKQFFNLLFGGLFAVIIGVSIAYGSSVAWKAARPALASMHFIPLASVASSIVSQPTDGTSISGFTRTIRYSADEEEDLISAASRTLPYSADKGVTALAYIVKNMASGDVPIEHDSDRILPIASLSKLVTAIIARKLIDPNDRITITQSIMSTYGNTAQFKVGETFTASDLYYPLLMVSSNDAAEAFAQSYGRAKFLKAMNDFTQSIGAYRTSFADPSGLSPLNVSSADDLILILSWIEKNDPGIISITNLKTKTVRSHTWINPTHFLSWSYYVGGKNGYTDEANRTGLALFDLGANKNEYAIIILGSGNRDADVIKLLGKVK